MMTFEQFKKHVIEKLEEYNAETNGMEKPTDPTQMSEQSWWDDFLSFVGQAEH